MKPPKGERGGAAMKASARLDRSMLWKDEPQEGIDGRNLRVPVSARTRRGSKALKAATSCPTPLGGRGFVG